MGCIISCGFKLVLQILNITLCLAFVAVGVFGVILKASKPVVESLLTKIFVKFEVGDEEIRDLAGFMVDNADGLSIILMAVGFGLALVCLFGFISACCPCGILLKIYAAILILLFIVEVAAVAYLFSDPKRISMLLVKSLQEAQKHYGKSSPEAATSEAAWNFITSFKDEPCCGIDNYEEFPNDQKLPLACCKPNQPTACTKAEAKAAGVEGCRGKIQKLVSDNTIAIMYVAIGAIVLQAILIVIVFLTICC